MHITTWRSQVRKLFSPGPGWGAWSWAPTLRTSPSSVDRRKAGRRFQHSNVEVLESRQLLAVTPELLRDINPLPAAGSYPYNFVNVSGVAYFTAEDPSHGGELWKSNGTATGTVLVKDINPGVNGSGPTFLTNVNGTLFFSAIDARHGSASSASADLWKSDGTSSGTVLLKDFVSGASGPGRISELVADGGRLYFTANDGVHGSELWTSDGTSSGTVLLKDSVSGSSGAGKISEHVAVGGRLYFTATDGVHGLELWTSDGTRAGTRIVKDIVAGSNGSAPSELTNINGALYFAAYTGAQGPRLWRSDGTAAGTIPLQGNADIQFGSSIYNLTDVNGTVYFAMSDDSPSGDFSIVNVGTHGTNLWKSDGTAAGTVLVKTIRAFTHSSPFRESIPVGAVDLVNRNGRLFFTAGGLWSSDGTSEGTVQFADPVLDGDAVHLTNVNGTLYFLRGSRFTQLIGIRPQHTPYVADLWKTDGTAAGTVRLKESNGYGNSSSGVGSLVKGNGTLYFTMDNGLWKSDGTMLGTVPVARNQFATVGTILNGNLIFSADDGQHGTEPWLLKTAGGPVVPPSRPEPTVNPLIVTNLSAPTFSFRVKYTGSTASPVNAATLKTGNVVVTGPNNYEQVAKFVSSSSSAGNSSITATYSITPPIGHWETKDQGIYTFSTGVQRVTDASGHALRQGKLGAFAVTYPVDLNGHPMSVRLQNGEWQVGYAEFPDSVLATKPASIPIVLHGPGVLHSESVFISNSSFVNPLGSTIVIERGSPGLTPNGGTLVLDTTGAQITQVPGNLSATSGQYMFDGIHTVRYSDTDTVYPIQRMYRAYNGNADQHVFTTSTFEFQAVTGYGLRDETSDQPGWAVAALPVAKSTPLYRLYNPNTGEHYYTTALGERDILVSVGWNFEKVEGQMFARQVSQSVLPIYRLYNKVSGGHLFTESQQTRDAILAQFPGIWVENEILGYAFAVGADEVRSSAAASSSVAQSQITAAEMAANVLALQSAGSSPEVAKPGLQPPVVATPAAEVQGQLAETIDRVVVPLAAGAEANSAFADEVNDSTLDEFWSAHPDTLTFEAQPKM